MTKRASTLRDQIATAHPRIVARIADPSAGSVIVILAPHYRLGRSVVAQARAARPGLRGGQRQ